MTVGNNKIFLKERPGRWCPVIYEKRGGGADCENVTDGGIYRPAISACCPPTESRIYDCFSASLIESRL